jgi:hypothetical protein
METEMNKRVLFKMIVVASAAGVFGCATEQKAPVGRLQGETAPAFHSYDVLPKEALKGAHYRINDRVLVEEYQYVFTVKSDFGEFTVHGRPMLDLRLRELKSIEAAQELSKDPKVVKGILDPLKDTGKGLGLLFTEPLESLGRIPKGFELMADQYLDPADRRAGSMERRKLAVQLDCDPETRNPVLKKLLDDMSLKHGGGSLLIQAAMSFVPGLSVLPTTAQMKETIANTPPSEINEMINEELEAAGVEESIRSRICKSSVFTTLQRMQLMVQFRALDGVRNRATIIEGAAWAYNEAEALSSIRGAKMLVDLRQRKPIQHLELPGLPLAVLNDGTHVIVCPYDYVTNTQELRDGVSAYRKANPNVTTILLTNGRVSSAARRTIESAHISIVEEGMSDS